MTFLIQYTAYAGADVIRSGKMLVKNQKSELAAKVNLEKFLQRKHKNMTKLVIHECIKDVFYDLLGINIYQ